MEPWKPATAQAAQTLINALKGVKPTPGNAGFIKSLIEQFDKKGFLSDKQWPYVQKMIAAAPVEEISPPKHVVQAPSKEPAAHFDGTAVKALFYGATNHIKFPNMHIPIGSPEDQQDKGTLKVYLSVNSPTERGNILFEISATKQKIARVDKEGKGYISPLCAPTVEALVREFAAAPTAYASMKGIQYKHCCFCRTELTNKISRYYGYGPICAEHFGLPWQDLTEEQDAEMQAILDKEMEKYL